MTDRFHSFATPEMGRRVSIDDIAACGEVATLLEWRRSFELRSDDMRAQMDARRTLGEAGVEEWLRQCSRALSYQLMGVRRIDRRLADLGCEIKGQELVDLRAELRARKERCDDLKVRLGYASRFAAAARAALSAEQYAQVLARLDQGVGEDNASETDSQAPA
jgi:hypothetical protein